MATQPSIFFSKLGVKGMQETNESKNPEVCFFHNLAVYPCPYKGREFLSQIGKSKIDDEHLVYTNPKTSFYLCKKYKHSTEWQRNKRFLMKRLAYRKNNTVDRWGRMIYNDSETKNYDQVATQFHCLNLLKESHRSIELISLLHQNTKSKEDKKFFYSNLKLPDRRSKGIKNVCFILEEMSGGSLRQQIDKINFTKEPLSEEKIVEYSCQFAEGLLELKAKGIIHRDLRPENVLIHNNQIKFGDFDSAFIKGYSDYRNIKNGVDMKETTPLEIMLLIAESEEKLQKLSSQELYQKQQKADIYFLGVNIYTMVFSQLFQSFNGGKVLNNLINIKKRSGFCPKLLDLMSRCLEKDAHVRINLSEVVKILSEIQREFYQKSSSYKRIYLGSEPLNLSSFSSNQNQSEVKNDFEFNNLNQRQKMDRLLDQALKAATIQRNTSMYEKMFKKNIEDVEIDQIWANSQKGKLVQLNQDILMNKIQNFLERLQIKAYYYELAYRILCEVNLVSVNSVLHFENIRSHIQLFSSELVVILSFIYGTIIKFPFTSDPYYDESNCNYQLRKIVENIKNLHSRWQFFNGRQNLQFKANKIKKQMRQHLNELYENDNKTEINLIQQAFKLSIEGIQIVESLVKMIEDLNSKTYDKEKERFIFQTEERYIMKYLDKMESIVKKQMIQTIISLILAYQKIKTEPWGHLSNLKTAIFMLMILQAQNTKIVEKNDLVIIKEELTTMIRMRLGWKSEELEAFFNNYTHTHTEEVIKGLCQLESQAIITTQQNQKDEDICIQINGLQKTQKVIENKILPIDLQVEKLPSLIEIIQEEKNEKIVSEEKLEEKKDKIIEESQVEQSRLKETFDYKLSEGEIKETSIKEKRDEKKNQSGIILVEYYD